ncbi:MAG: prepilin peptidase [Armatimonadetes bacterium]|nr:prepilin peptidase [Armatimonadota bacterium]
MPVDFGAVIMFLYGLVVGSFLNVLIYRMPKEESVTTPPSRCPSCDTRLRPRDLIPLFSFLLSRTRCRYCGEKVSWRYFGVELLTGVLFAATVLINGFTWDTILECLFVAVLIAIFFIDLDHFIIPDELNLAGVVIGVARDMLKLALDPSWALARIPIPFTGAVVHAPRSLVGILVCAGLLYLIALIGTWMFKKDAMGMGDVKLAAAFGANLTLAGVLVAFFFAVGIGAVVGVLLMATRLRSREDMLPFGPFLVTGALVAMYWGPQIFNWYVNTMLLRG